jgi:hypothetical protein
MMNGLKLFQVPKIEKGNIADAVNDLFCLEKKLIEIGSYVGYYPT